MDKYLNSTIEKYIADLSARKMAPGGGSAAALTVSIGSALNLMVINFSLTENQKEKNNADLIIIKNKQEAILKDVVELIDEDIAVFTSLMLKIKDKTVSSVDYKNAAMVPFKTATSAYESAKVSKGLIGKSNKHLISDIGCAINNLAAGFNSATLNVYVNFRGIEDKSFCQDLTEKLSNMKAEIEQIGEEIVSFMVKKT